MHSDRFFTSMSTIDRERWDEIFKPAPKLVRRDPDGTEHWVSTESQVAIKNVAYRFRNTLKALADK